MLCPITYAPIQHPCHLHGRFLFETEAILEWLKHHSLTNPYTNEPMKPDWAASMLVPGDEDAARLIQAAGFLGGGQVSKKQYHFFLESLRSRDLMWSLVLVWMMQPFNLYAHRIRAALGAWSFVFAVLGMMCMAYIAFVCIMLALLCVALSFAGHWVCLVAAYLLMRAAHFIALKMRDGLEVLIDTIIGAVYFLLPVIILGAVLCLLMRTGIVEREHVEALRVVSWFLPKLMADAFEGAQSSSTSFNGSVHV